MTAPPQFAVRLVTLFTPSGRAEAILGDLAEEFASQPTQTARGWYWRQSINTIIDLACAAYRSSPWTFTALVLGAFLLRWCVSMFAGPFIRAVISGDYKTVMLVQGFTFNLVTGGALATLAAGREMAATLSLALLGIILALQSIAMTIHQTGDYGVLVTLPHTLAFSAAIVAAGAIVRTQRQPA